MRDLYETREGDKKHRFRLGIIKRYKKGIDNLKRAWKIEDLFLLPSLRYEVIKGDKAGISSIGVISYYYCYILELSNH